MTKALTPLAVQNRDVLEHLATKAPPASIDAFARDMDRDRSNFRKSLKALEAEGWITLSSADGKPSIELTADGRRAVEGLSVAAGRLRAGLPPLIHTQIVPDPNQPRIEFEPGELEELAESIAERGQLQPLLVRMTAADAAMIVDGERRWRGIGLLIARDDPRWPAVKPVDYHLSARTDEAEILIDQVVANLQRADLHELEEAVAFSRLKATGWGVGQIAKAVGKTRKFVETRLDLLLLPQAQQDRMRLARDNPDRLSFTRAREIVQHLRSIASQQAEQRDVEEIAPTPTLADVGAELQEAAGKIKVDARGMLILGEIAEIAASNPSNKFPSSPTPVADVASSSMALRDRALEQLSAPRHLLAELLIDGDSEDRPAGIRLTDLGHAKLRQHDLHPADNARNLYHLRREVGLSADQARQAARDGRFVTPWLNPPADREITPGGIKLLAHEILAAVEIADRTIRRDHLDPAHPGHLLVTEHPIMTTVAALGRAKVAVSVTGGSAQAVSIALTKGGSEWLKGMDLWPESDGQAAVVLAKARAAAGLEPAYGDEYATDWLNVRATAPQPRTVEEAPPAEEFGKAALAAALERAAHFSPAVREAALTAYRAERGNERAISAKLSGTTTVEGETWPADETERLATDWSDYPRAEIRLTVSDRGRWYASVSTQAGSPAFGGRGEPWHVYTSDPIFSSRAHALDYAAARIVRQLGETWGRKRKLQAWLTELQQAPQTPAVAAADATAELSDVQIRILRELQHAQAANDGQAVRVGRYWLDLDAIGIWKLQQPLLAFAASPGDGWRASLTEAGAAIVGGLDQDEFNPTALELRIAREGKYSADWLNVEPAAAPVPAAEGAPPAAEEEEPKESELLRQIREGLAGAAPDFAQLLRLAGLAGEFSVTGDAAIVATPTEGGRTLDVAVVDQYRQEEEDVAQARAELLAYVLNLISGHAGRIDPSPKAIRDAYLEGIAFGIGMQDGSFDAEEHLDPEFWADAWIDSKARLAFARDGEILQQPEPPLLELRAGDVVTKGGAMTWRLLEAIAKPSAPAHAFKAQPILHGKDHGKPTTISIGDITAVLPRAQAEPKGDR